MNTIKRHVRKGTHVPIRKILKYTKTDYYQDASRCYAEGWAICYYLLDVGPIRTPRMANKYRSIPTVMMRELEKHGNGQKATRKAFAGIDLEALERDFVKWINELEMPEKVKAALRKAEEKANRQLMEECAELAKEWTKKQQYVEKDPPCSAIIVQCTKEKKFKGCARGVHEAEFKVRSLDEMKALVKAVAKATSNNPKLVAVRIYTATGYEDKEEYEALKEFTDKLYDWCDTFDIMRLARRPGFMRGVKLEDLLEEEEGD